MPLGGKPHRGGHCRAVECSTRNARTLLLGRIAGVHRVRWIQPARRALRGADPLMDGIMSDLDRRAFLAGLGKAGAVVAAAPWLDAIGLAQDRGPARAFLR